MVSLCISPTLLRRAGARRARSLGFALTFICAGLCVLVSWAAPADEASTASVLRNMKDRGDQIQSYSLSARTFYLPDPHRDPSADFDRAAENLGGDPLDQVNKIVATVGPEPKVMQSFKTAFEGDRLLSRVLRAPGAPPDIYAKLGATWISTSDQPQFVQVDLTAKAFPSSWFISLDSLDVDLRHWLQFPVASPCPPGLPNAKAVLAFQVKPTIQTVLSFDAAGSVRRVECLDHGKRYLAEWYIGSLSSGGFTVPRAAIVLRINDDGKLHSLEITFVDDVTINGPVPENQLSISYPTPITVIDKRGGHTSGFRLNKPNDRWTLQEIVQVANDRKPTTQAVSASDRPSGQGAGRGPWGQVSGHMGAFVLCTLSAAVVTAVVAWLSSWARRASWPAQRN